MICAAYCSLNGRSGHEAGRYLLQKLYLQAVGTPVPEIAVTKQGKPFFPDSPYFFSISHTKNTAFCALSCFPIGIDAEETDRSVSARLFDKVLSPAEQVRVRNSLNPNEAFLKLWVLKEAEAKWKGTGLQGYPNKTDFSPDDPRVQICGGCYVAIRSEEPTEGVTFYAF